MAEHSRPGRFRRLLGWLAVAAATALLPVYVASYAYLSRRGMAEARATGFTYFFYCPVADLRPGEELPAQHRVCLVLFGPLNQLDRRWFGGPDACRCVLWGLSR
jgi:hypothetical protein